MFGIPPERKKDDSKIQQTLVLERTTFYFPFNDFKPFGKKNCESIRAAKKRSTPFNDEIQFVGEGREE